jgi:hypothetical protein
VSESGAHSDRKEPIKPNRVRIKGSFGQERAHQAKPCPNQGLIRTGKSPSSQTVSESGAHSDRKEPIKPNRVRIRGSFGQEIALQAKPCPNQGLIRTGKRLSSQTVSESGAHSDKKEPFRPNLVRIRGSFGQETVLQAKPCPSRNGYHAKNQQSYENQRKRLATQGHKPHETKRQKSSLLDSCVLCLSGLFMELVLFFLVGKRY